jgi:hypothetical protein
MIEVIQLTMLTSRQWDVNIEFDLHVKYRYICILLFQIAFSKFFRASKGRLQDKQEKVILEKVAHLGFTCADQNSGPFQLEMDYIMLLHDKTHSEEFAYEDYETTPGIAGN